MSQLLLVLWASTVFMELNRGLMANVVPAGNLSCFQCFKVPWADQCQPIECKPREKVCVSNEVLIYTSTKSKAQISKRCAISCPNSNSIFEWSVSHYHARITRQCCAGDLCNRAPESWQGFQALLGRLLLSMGLGLFCTLLG
ncbi:lymphocyte antigen 6L-like [Arvicanthis niloticus]|uniref:lymphocyte antigen 6L-like n=1 Tax=Arvicanthis niloticus TaxID=61156 RepID=UPI0014863D4A|nr:lymphocyte antigen 6L-like [Arvicanthis niloticus]